MIVNQLIPIKVSVFKKSHWSIPIKGDDQMHQLKISIINLKNKSWTEDRF